MLLLFGVHGPGADPSRLAPLVAAMDKAVDPAVHAASRDLTPDPALRIRLRSPTPERLDASVAEAGGITVAGKARLYDEAGPPKTDLSRIAAALAANPGAFPHRTSDFGLAVWNSARREFSLAADAFGSAPIYYVRLGDTLAFANWPHLLLALPEFARNLDPVAAAAYLGAVPQPPERTFFRGLRRLAQAQSLTRRPDGTEAFAIGWRPGPSPGTSSIDDVADATVAAVSGRLRHTAHPAIMLSGGLDSALVAGLATELRPDLRFQALSNVLPEGYSGEATDERAYVEAALAANPTISPGYVTSDGADVFGGAEAAWSLLAAPCLDPYGYMTDRAMIRAGAADAVLDGFGGDQCLSAGGGPYLFEMLVRGRIGAALDEWATLRRVYGTGRISLFHHSVFSRLPIFPLWKSLRGPVPARDALAAVAEPEARDHLRRWGHRRHAAAETSMRMLERDGLATIEDWMMGDLDLPREGRSVPTLHPLMDPRLIEAVMAAPSDLKVGRDRDRALVRAIGGDRLPPLIANRIDKMPFAPDYLTLVAARAAEIAAGYARFRKNPLWRDLVDADAAEATLAHLTGAPEAADIDAVLGQVVRTYFFGLFLDRAFD